jgi:hypothetical protein
VLALVAAANRAGARAILSSRSRMSPEARKAFTPR